MKSSYSHLNKLEPSLLLYSWRTFSSCYILFILCICCEEIIERTDSITVFVTSLSKIDIKLVTPALLTVVETIRIVSGFKVGNADSDGRATNASNVSNHEFAMNRNSLKELGLVNYAD